MKVICPASTECLLEDCPHIFPHPVHPGCQLHCFAGDGCVLFTEIEQVPTPFILRTKGQKVNDDSPMAITAMLLDADGGGWKHEAIRRIGEWLRTQLGDGVTILS